MVVVPTHRVVNFTLHRGLGGDSGSALPPARVQRESETNAYPIRRSYVGMGCHLALHRKYPLRDPSRSKTGGLGARVNQEGREEKASKFENSMNSHSLAATRQAFLLDF